MANGEDLAVANKALSSGVDVDLDERAPILAITNVSHNGGQGTNIEEKVDIDRNHLGAAPTDYLRDSSGYDDYICRTYTAEELTQRRHRCYLRCVIGLAIAAAICITLGLVFEGRLQDTKKVCTIRGTTPSAISLETGTETGLTPYFWWGAIVRRWTYSNGTDITQNLQYSVDRCDQVVLQGPAHMTSGAINITKPQTILEFRNNFILNASVYVPDYPVIPSLPALRTDDDDETRSLYELTESSGRDACTSPPYVNVRFQPFIYIQNTRGVVITGNGTVDGGGDFWSLFCGDKRLFAERPILVGISNSQDIVISTVTLDNSAMWPLNTVGSSGIVLANLTVGIRTAVTVSFTPISRTIFYIPKQYVNLNLLLTESATELLVGQEDILSGQKTLFTSQSPEDVAESWPEFVDYCQIQNETRDEGNITYVKVGDFVGTLSDVVTGSKMSIAVTPVFDEMAPNGRFDELILMNTPNLLSLMAEKLDNPQSDISLWDIPIAGGILNLAFTLIRYRGTGEFEANPFLEDFVLLYPKDWNLTIIVCPIEDDSLSD